jgi:hypothetical protein
MSKKTRLAIAAAVAALIASHANAATFAKPGTLRRAVQVYYQANDYVQAAVYVDVCGDDGLHDSQANRVHLKPRSAKRYDKVRATLGQVYAATNQTDGELEQVRNDFCSAAESR